MPISPTGVSLARRSQSMRSLARVSDFKPIAHTQTQSASTSSSSSVISISSIIKTAEAESKPFASTSALSEVELQPLAEKPKHVSFTSAAATLNEAQMSHIADRINPSRDGVYSQIRNTIRRYSAAVAVGSGIAAGGIAVANIMNNNNLNQSLITTMIANGDNITMTAMNFTQHADIDNEIDVVM